MCGPGPSQQHPGASAHSGPTSCLDHVGGAGGCVGVTVYNL